MNCAEQKIEIDTLNAQKCELESQQRDLQKSRLQKFRVGQHTVDPRLVRGFETRDAALRDGFIYLGNQEFYFQEDQSVVSAFFKKDTEYKLALWFDGSYFNVAKQEEHQKHLENEKSILKLSIQIRDIKIKMNTLIQEVERTEFWEHYNLPFKFVVSIKPVLSGLTKNSWGDGSKKNSTYHVVLMEEYKDGRLSRKEDEFLCSQPKGKHVYHGTGGLNLDASLLQEIVTCKECLKKIEKFKNEHA